MVKMWGFLLSIYTDKYILKRGVVMVVVMVVLNIQHPWKKLKWFYQYIGNTAIKQQRTNEMEQSGNQSTIINCLIKEVERLKEENEHLKAANSNARFIQLCMKEAAEKAAAEHAALKDDYDQLTEDYRALNENHEQEILDTPFVQEIIREGDKTRRELNADIAERDAKIAKLKKKKLALKDDYDQLTEDYRALNENHEQLQKASEAVYAKHGEERLEMLATDKLINFDDENYEYYWTAENGDIVFWKIPNDLAIMPHPEEPDLNRVLSAFMDNLFGDEWGQLSSFGVRTMTKQDLIDADGFIDE